MLMLRCFRNITRSSASFNLCSSSFAQDIMDLLDKEKEAAITAEKNKRKKYRNS